MTCSIKNPAQRRFVISAWLSPLLIALLVVPAAMAVRLGHLHGPLLYPLAVLPALPILWVLYETGRWLAVEKDEFQRTVLVQCMLGGIGGTLATTTVWGFLESVAHAPHLPLATVYAIFWVFVGISAPVVIARYR